jgi:hypothetical protein
MTSNEDGGSVLLAMLPDLNGGKFLGKVDTALISTALATIACGEKGKTGKVTLEFTLSRIGESNQVRLEHAVTMTQPTARGKRSETDCTETPLHVGRDGKLTLMPDTQMRFDYDRSGE